MIWVDGARVVGPKDVIAVTIQCDPRGNESLREYLEPPRRSASVEGVEPA